MRRAGSRPPTRAATRRRQTRTIPPIILVNAVGCQNWRPVCKSLISRAGAEFWHPTPLFSPIDGERKLPTVATRDIAAAAARLLLDASWSGVDEVPLLGPEDLSFSDMAEIMSEVLGKEVRFQQTTLERYKNQVLGFGMSDAMAQGQTDMAWAKNEGIDNAVQRTPENSTPTSFRQWSEEVLKPAVLKQTAAAPAS